MLGAAAALVTTAMLLPPVHDAMVEKISGATDSVAELAKKKYTKQEQATAEREANNGVSADNWLLPIKNCLKDGKSAILCGLFVMGGITILHNNYTYGQDDNYSPILTPVSAPTSTQTSTQTPAPTSTSTSTPTQTPKPPVIHGCLITNCS